MNWETTTVIEQLLGDDEAHEDTQTMSVRMLRRWVESGCAPEALYETFRNKPYSSLAYVDWATVSNSLR